MFDKFDDRYVPSLDDYAFQAERHRTATASRAVFVVHPQTFEDLLVTLKAGRMAVNEVEDSNLGKGVQLFDCDVYPDLATDVGVIDNVRSR